MTLIEQLFKELESGHLRVETRFKEKYLTMERDQIDSAKISIGLSADADFPTPSEVLNVVSKITDIEVDRIPSQDRHTRIAFSRQLYSYLVMKYCKVTSSTAGIYINRTHATVLHSIKKIEELEVYGNEWEKHCIRKGKEFFQQY